MSPLCAWRMGGPPGIEYLLTDELIRSDMGLQQDIGLISVLPSPLGLHAQACLMS